MSQEREALEAFRQSAGTLGAVMREQDREITRIIEDLRRAVRECVEGQARLREEAEDTARAASDGLWHIDRNERYARTDEEKIAYAEQTRQQAVLLAEAKAEADERARRAAEGEERLRACQKDVEQAAYEVERILNGPGNTYAETLGTSIGRLEQALDDYLQTDTYVSHARR